MPPRSGDSRLAGAALLHTDIGPMLIPEQDQVIRPWIEARGTWEPEESRFFRERLRPGMIAMDIGAHCGYFTLLFAQLVGAAGAVIAIEADPRNHELLRENVSRAGLTNVRLVHAAAASESGIARLSISPDNTGDHRAYTWESGREVIEVPALALDDLTNPSDALDVVKLDVQGTEHRVVEGMREAISRFRPTLLVEFWPTGIREAGDAPREALQLYRSLGYRLSLVDDQALRPYSDDELLEVAGGRFCNLVLEPLDP